MKGETKVLIGGLLTTIVLIIGVAMFMGKDNSPKREQLGTASLSVDQKEKNLGDMKVSEEKSATFTITNTSNSALRIWNITTSCNCTFASVIIGKEKTGEFNMPMHTPGYLKNWIGEIPVQQKAQLVVTYKPSVMPVQGIITRQITFESNDPKNQSVELSVKANVL